MEDELKKVKAKQKSKHINNSFYSIFLKSKKFVIFFFFNIKTLIFKTKPINSINTIPYVLINLLSYPNFSVIFKLKIFFYLLCE